jgi:hypothetical protein
VAEPLVFGHRGAPVTTSSDGERRTMTAKEIRSQSSPPSMYVLERLTLGEELLISVDLVPECRRSCVWPPWSSRSSPPSNLQRASRRGGRKGSGGQADEGRRGSGARRARRSSMSSLLALADGGRRGGRLGRRRGNPNFGNRILRLICNVLDVLGVFLKKRK